MCFSATASFSAAGVVSVAGAVAVVGARRPAHRLIALIPLIFAIHQAAEGVLWLALSSERFASGERPALFTYLILTRVLWPIWVPLSVLVLEPSRMRRTILTVLVAVGAGVAVAEAYGLRVYPVRVSIDGGHLLYQLGRPPAFRWPTDVTYALVIVLPAMVASNPRLRRIGLLLLAAFIVSKLVWYRYFLSVWCFFAALLSALIVLLVRRPAGRATVVPEPV
jgi:hypothetical protein